MQKMKSCILMANNKNTFSYMGTNTHTHDLVKKKQTRKKWNQECEWQSESQSCLSFYCFFSLRNHEHSSITCEIVIREEIRIIFRISFSLFALDMNAPEICHVNATIWMFLVTSLVITHCHEYSEFDFSTQIQSSNLEDLFILSFPFDSLIFTYEFCLFIVCYWACQRILNCAVGVFGKREWMRLKIFC